MATDNEFFPPACVTRASLRDLRTAIFEAQALGAEEIKILGYDSGMAHESLRQPWFCFNIDDARYAIWRTTGDLYEVDATGAVGDDPISGPLREERDGN